MPPSDLMVAAGGHALALVGRLALDAGDESPVEARPLRRGRAPGRSPARGARRKSRRQGQRQSDAPLGGVLYARWPPFIRRREPGPSRAFRDGGIVGSAA